MNIKCPHCGTAYEVDKKDMYRYAECEACGKGFVIGSDTSLLSPDKDSEATKASVEVPITGKIAPRRTHTASPRTEHIVLPDRFAHPKNSTAAAPSSNVTQTKSGMRKIMALLGMLAGIIIVLCAIALGAYRFFGDEPRLNRGITYYEKGSYSNAYKLLLPLAKKGYAKAQLYVGDCLANGRLSNVECYVLGIDPESETNDFKIVSLPMKADGTPDWEHIVYEPAETKWNVSGARAVLKGAEALGGGWKAVEEASEADKAKMRFFKGEVELP